MLKPLAGLVDFIVKVILIDFSSRPYRITQFFIHVDSFNLEFFFRGRNFLGLV